MRRTYPSDITRAHFESIRPLLDSAKKKTKPPKLDLYDLFCGVLYVLKSGCQWRMIPADFPAWQSVYAYFRTWSAPRDDGPSLLEVALKKSAWRGPQSPWAGGTDHLPERGCAKRQEHRHGGSERL
jgi:transposase